MDRIGVSVLLYKVQEALAVGGSRRRAAQSGGIFCANPDAPLAAPHLAQLLKPNQGLICAGNGGFASFASLALHCPGPSCVSGDSRSGSLELRLRPLPV
jgi:hypothetical protein